MIRATLIAIAALATIAIVGPAAAQTGAPVRTLGAPDAATNSAVSTAERKATPCAGESCASKPKRFQAAAPLGW